MVKRVVAIATVGGLALIAVLLTTATRASAQSVTLPTSDRAAGLVIFPKVVADPGDMFTQGRAVDTLIQLTNTSSTDARTVHCNIIDATSHCVTQGTQCTLSNHILNTADPVSGACRTNTDCDLGGVCAPCWNETDFATLTLSPDQAVGWTISSGGTVPLVGPTPPPSTQPVPPAPESFFIGELKCFEAVIDSTGAVIPINANDLKGEATIEEVASGTPGSVSARGYNAIGVQAVKTDGSQQNDQVLCLGATVGSTECTTAEYASCPSVLILNHWFDFLTPPNTVSTDLTLVPCTEDFVDQTCVETTVQFLVFNEFEQRFSTSIPFSCFKETRLSNIDERLGQEGASIFNFAVAGTLAGQTRIRGVQGSDPEAGNGLLGVAEEFIAGSGSAAFNLNYVGVRTGWTAKGDFIRIP